MELIFRFSTNFLLGMFTVLMYRKIIADNAMKWLCKLSAPLCFAIWMLISYNIIPEPFRSILGIVIIGAVLWLWRRKLNIAVLILAFLFGQFVRAVSLFVAAIVGYLLHLQTNQEAAPLFLLADVILYFAAYKILRFKKTITYIESVEIKGIIFAATGIILSFIGIQHLNYNQIQEYNYPLFWAIVLSLIFLIIALTLLIIFFARNHNKQRKFEAKQQKLEEQYDELVAKDHDNNSVIPAFRQWLSQMQQQGTTIENNTELNAMYEMAKEISIDFSDRDTQTALNIFNVPQEWSALYHCIKAISLECRQKHIEVSIQNKVDKKGWDKLSVSKVDFIRLVGNLFSNAKKELSKMDAPGKIVTVLFRDKYDAFELDIHDNAPAFPIEILQRLGQRGNSTNGTGNGYAEIFEFLRKYKASLRIYESSGGTDCYKRINVKLDGQSQVAIYTDSRHDTLSNALEDTMIDVYSY